MLPTVTPETFSAIMRKARALLIEKKYEEALDVIILIQEDVDNFMRLGEERLIIYFNNVAVLYYLLRKPCLSSLYLNKAHKVCLFRVFRRGPNETSSRQPQTFFPETFYKIMYNMGLCMLFAMKPMEAFCYFRKAVQGMHRSPLVWLRLAECCMMAYKKDHEGVFNFLQKRNLLASGKVGSGLASNIILNSKLYRDSDFNCDPQSFYGLGPSLGFATICLKNSFLLLPLGNSKLKQAVLAASSYVHLTIGSPVKAYKYASFLFADASFHIYKYLGKLYLAESLIIMNRIQEAINVLKPTQLNDWDPVDDLQAQKWFSNIHITSHAVLNYNLAVALVMNEEFYKAAELLKNVWRFKGTRNEVPIHIIALALYIELVLGHIDVARIIIKQNCPQLFEQC